MLSETVILPKNIEGNENRFIIQLKAQLLKEIKKINELEQKIVELDERLRNVEE